MAALMTSRKRKLEVRITHIGIGRRADLTTSRGLQEMRFMSMAETTFPSSPVQRLQSRKADTLPKVRAALKGRARRPPWLIAIARNLALGANFEE